ncbi:MAG TPA: hypothetical protein VLB76_23000 [Thermoanaerobaculia bacterium]|jgi:hypothetical protein|nr:hypothetical protein [Thermoanaerobaculia bacterium]
MSDNSLTGILSDWDGLLAAVEANREDLPYVEPCRVLLEASLTDLRALHARRATLQAELRRSTRDLRDLVACGRDLAVRVRYGVRSRYGFRSDKLAEFGIRPSRKGRSPRGRPAPGNGEKGAPRNPTAP